MPNTTLINKYPCLKATGSKLAHSAVDGGRTKLSGLWFGLCHKST